MPDTRTTLEPTDRPIDIAVLERRADGFGIDETATLGSLLSAPGARETTRLLVFLRHFG